MKAGDLSIICSHILTDKIAKKKILAVFILSLPCFWILSFVILILFFCCRVWGFFVLQFQLLRQWTLLSMKPLFSYDDMQEFYVILGHGFSKRQNGIESTHADQFTFSLLTEWSILQGNMVLFCPDKCSLVNGSSRTLPAGLIFRFFDGLGFFF